MSKTTNKYSAEVRERSVRMVLDHEGQHESRWAAILSISSKIGCAPQTLNEWVKKAKVDSGRRTGMPTAMTGRLKALDRENRELRQRSCASLFCDGGARAPVEDMIAFIDDHREVHGLAPICKVLPIAPSTDHDHLAKRADPSRLSARARRDAEPRGKIARVFEDTLRVYGVRKV